LKPFRRLRRTLIEADLETPPHLVLLLSGGGALVVFVAVYQAMGWIVPSLFAAAGIGAIPIVYVWWRRESRLTEKEEALVVALKRVYEELRTVTIQEALVSLGSTAPLPVRPVFQRLAADLAQQRDYGDALRASKVRLGSQVWDDCVAGLLLAHEVGERNIREVFQRIASNARAQVQLRRRVYAQQAEQIMGARITLVVPVAVVVFMRVSFPDADRFYTSPGGELVLLVCGLAMLLGYWSMLKIGRISRPAREHEDGA
jgi:Flp pilus assembly protein TadB